MFMLFVRLTEKIVAEKFTNLYWIFTSAS